MNSVDGYVGELEYVHGFYPEMGPSALNLVLLLQGIEPVPLHQGFTYCDLGCGQAVTSNTFAACHQEGTFHAIDFNHAHIAGAAGMADRASLGNITFWEARFSDLHKLPLPDFDFIVLHGVYSWVNRENRQYILDFIRQKLKVGGTVYVSYNSQPGWAAFAAVRQLMTSYADGLSGRLEERIDRSVAFIESLKARDLSFFKANDSVNTIIEHISRSPKNYIAHEYFNRDWTLFFHSEVANDLSGADLTFAGSAVFADNLDFLRFPEEEQQVFNRIADPLVRETVKDFAVNQRFRRDVFTRKRTRLTQAGQRELFDAVRFAAVLPEAETAVPPCFTRGEIQLSKEVHIPVLDVLQQHQSLDGLLRDPVLSHTGRDRIVQALLVLLAAKYIMPVTEPSTASLLSAKRFNLMFLEETINNTGIQHLVSPQLQAALPLDWFERLSLLCELTECRDPLDLIRNVMLGNGRAIERNGVRLSADTAGTGVLTAQLNEFRTGRLPLLYRFGVI